jgi:L-iditol 2-dehydrogenase
MRAAQLVAPGRLEVGEFPVPEPAAGQVLVRTIRASICGSDTHVVFDGFEPVELPSRPGYPGHEGVGEVVAGGAPDLQPGDLVLTVPVPTHSGCFAEYQAIDVGSVIKLPADGDPVRLLMAQQLGTTILAMRRFWSGPGAAAATLIGAGSAGLFFLQQLRRLGFGTIVVSDLEPARLEIARELGASVCVDARSASVVEATMDLTGGEGADLVIEAAGYDVCRAQAVASARIGGRVGCFGFPERKGEAPFPVEQAFRRSVAVQWSIGAQTEPGLRSFREAVAAIGAGQIEVDYCSGPAFPVEAVPEAMAQAHERGRGAVKMSIAF